jgi:nucleotide sugar dehydrogenase
MRISIVGTGYVGLPAGAGLASEGHDVTCVDIDEEKVEEINNGNCPIFEEGLPELLEEQVNKNNLEATTETEKAVRESDITFLAVGTPMEEDGSINLDYIKQAAKDAAQGLTDDEEYHVFVVKSTVVPETTQDEIIPILEEETGLEAGKEFGVCMNPEFLREGTALQDFMEPDRVVIGELNERSGEKLERIYESWDAPVMRTSLEAAELIKYASNSLLATKISFINEVGNLCKELGIDVYEVADGVGMDHRIKRDFLNSGDGFGGSCFPKDVRALISFMEEQGVQPRLLESTIDVNVKQKTKLVDILQQRIDVKDSEVAVLGLAFKPGTDDVRKSPAIPVIQELKDSGAQVNAYDPEAADNMRQKHHPDINYCDTRQEALEGADAALVVTDWSEFDQITREELKTMENQLVLEGMKPDYDIPNEVKEGVTWP